LKTNALYYGDNLDILRRYVPDASVDLIYLDPPFNSNRDYNVIFKDESGRKSDAQLLAFEDTWHWGPSAEGTYSYLTNTARHEGRVPSAVSQIVAALRVGIGTNQMLAYIVEMAERLVELHRVLKPTGSLYLHCDPTASHYLKLLLDAVFGPINFRNEIIWKRTGAHNSAKRFGPVHDSILFYVKSEDAVFTRVKAAYDLSYVESHFRSKDQRGRYQAVALTGPGLRKGDSGLPWRGYDPGSVGRHWQPASYVYSKYTELTGDDLAKYPLIERFDKLDEVGLIYRSKGGDGVPRYRFYLDDAPGVPLQDIWDDLPPVNSQSKERLGWETQKPVSLLERIIGASSAPGDVVLDPFCRCGTALIAAQTMDRKWIGIDVTYLSIAVMRARLKDSFGLENVEVIGQPTEVEGARQLAQSPEGRYQFQWWALALVDAKPLGGVEKKGSDRGIDGLITFTDKNNELHLVVVSVKSGGVTSGMVRDLKGTLDRENAAIGLFVTLEEPTKEMRLEASTAGVYHSDLWNRDYPKIQLLSIRELLEDGRKPELPPFVLPTYQQAQKVTKASDAEQKELFG
jgi:site-specific DNA-methyltransferase (adenine-specific)